jgi:hypothetical protein
VLTSGTQVRGFEFFRAKKSSVRIPSKGYQVADLWHVKDPFNGVEVAIVGKIIGHFSPTITPFAARGPLRRCGRGDALWCKWGRLKRTVVQ